MSARDQPRSEVDISESAASNRENGLLFAGETSFCESSYADADHTRSRALSEKDARVGIGCTLERTPTGAHLVTSVKRGGACDNGGVKAGMYMLAINGVHINGKSMKDVRRLSMGAVGSSVTVIIRRSSTSPPEQGTLTRCATNTDALTNDDRTIITPRGPLQSDNGRSDRSAGPSWLSRMFRADKGLSKKSQTTRPTSSQDDAYKRSSAPEVREMQPQKVGQTLNGLVGEEARTQAPRPRTSDGRLIEYDKDGQVM